jgi:hypothetical protein
MVPASDLDASLLPEREEPAVPTLEAVMASDFSHEGCEGWTAKECGSYSYWGGRTECGAGSEFTTTISAEDLELTTDITFKAKVWTIDSWDNE